MVLIDTSIWVDVFRDNRRKRNNSGKDSLAARLRRWLDGRDVQLTRFNQLELLQGCRDEKEWNLLSTYLEVQDYVECAPTTWQAAARIYFDLRRQGLTVRSPIDCCIAQLALENGLLLLHNDRDFVTIASIRPLTHHHWQNL